MNKQQGRSNVQNMQGLYEVSLDQKQPEGGVRRTTVSRR